MRLTDLHHLQLQQHQPEEEAEEKNVQQKEAANPEDIIDTEQQPSLYPSLQIHWQEIGVPTTPSGEVDLMHFQALYHHQKHEFETESQFRQRIGVDAYKSQFQKTEDIPVIWRHIAYALPDKCYDIKTLWFNDYPIHQQDFTTWWTQKGINLSWSWDNGQFKTNGNELQIRHQEKHDNARSFINHAPESLRLTIINLYGKWSL
jgi:hypothetical protein